MTVWHAPQRGPLTWETFLDIDESVRADLEIVDGYAIPREQRGRGHQKVGTRLSLALEQDDSYETNTEVDVLLWEVPPTARKPDAVLHRFLPEFQQLTARDVVIVAEVLSTWSERRDRVHKMADYADAGIPHYWLVGFDKVGAVSIERYALIGGAKPYVHIGTTHRDMGAVAVEVTAPFPIRMLWAELEVAPQVSGPQ